MPSTTPRSLRINVRMLPMPPGPTQAAPSTPSSCTVAGSSPSTPAPAPPPTPGALAWSWRCQRHSHPRLTNLSSGWRTLHCPPPHTRTQLGSLPPPRVSSSCLLTGSHPQHGLVFPFFLCSALLPPCKEPINCRRNFRICFVQERYPGYYEDLISLTVLSHVRNKELANYWGLMCVNTVSLALSHALWFMHCLWLTVELQEENWVLLHGLLGPLTWNTIYSLRKVCWSLF